MDHELVICTRGGNRKLKIFNHHCEYVAYDAIFKFLTLYLFVTLKMFGFYVDDY